MLTVYFLSILSLNNPRAVPRRPDSARKKDWPRAGTRRGMWGGSDEGWMEVEEATVGGQWRRRRRAGGEGGEVEVEGGGGEGEEEEEDA